jgi:hypothetical protein
MDRPDPLRDLWDRNLGSVYEELVRSLNTHDGRIDVLQTLANIKISQEESRNADKLANYTWWLAFPTIVLAVFTLLQVIITLLNWRYPH